LVLDQLVVKAGTPLNCIVLLACIAPKFDPVIVTGNPAAPDAGEIVAIIGGTVYVTALLVTPPTRTVIDPVDAPLGTGTVMLVVLQLDGPPGTPLNKTLLDPCVAPKFDPLIVTAVPAGPETGEILVMLGATVKVT
jgi:hypothetical protein